jgi:DNA-binding MarR family transcriptional regulator
MARATTTAPSAPSHDEAMDAVLAASRVLVAVAARSVSAAGEDVTLPQFRTLVVLAYKGPQRTIDLAEELAVNSSTATRMIDRLVRRTLVHRTAHPEDGRANRVEITDTGRGVVATVNRHRRAELSRLLRKMQPEKRRALMEGLEALRIAAGEPAEQGSATGWL